MKTNKLQGMGKLTPKGLWVCRRAKEIDPEAWGNSSTEDGRLAKAIEQAIKEFESGAQS